MRYEQTIRCIAISFDIVGCSHRNYWCSCLVWSKSSANEPVDNELYYLMYKIYGMDWVTVARHDGGFTSYFSFFSCPSFKWLFFYLDHNDGKKFCCKSGCETLFWSSWEHHPEGFHARMRFRLAASFFFLMFTSDLLHPLSKPHPLNLGYKL